jgi:DMSO/TMAO reductase YedYZ molybdopterin-dependent catalytic subunit
MADPAPSSGITHEELQLAARNHGTPLEALASEITPAGLHYLLTHYDVPVIDPEAWRLRVGGRVERELELSLDELRSRPAHTAPVTIECAGNGRAHLDPRPLSQPWLVEAVGTAEWTGASLAALLDEAGVEPDAVEVLLSGLDRGVEGGIAQSYERSLPLADARREEVLLAYEMNGSPLPPQHGAPVRVVVPGWYGMTSVKWLGRITVLAEPFDGYQNARAYRFRQSDDEEGEPVTRIQPRALMVPPGVPEFMSRERHLAAGEHELRGRAWSGWAPVERVEVSVDGGGTWADAELGEQPGPAAWRPWSWRWRVDSPGAYELCCRAQDAAGNTQPLDPPWNLGGYANNAVQRITVHVGSGPV